MQFASRTLRLSIRDQCERAQVPFFFTQWGGVRNPDAWIIPAPQVEKLKQEWLNQYGVYFGTPEQWNRLEPYRNAWATYFP
jgi:hypothetical protein